MIIKKKNYWGAIVLEPFSACKSIVKYEFKTLGFSKYALWPAWSTVEIQKQSLTRFLENSCSESFLKAHRKHQWRSTVLITFLVCSIIKKETTAIIISKFFKTVNFKKTTGLLLLKNEYVLHIVICIDS